MEKQINNSINFLDLKITNHKNKIEFGIFRKETYTDNIIHAESNHPMQHKLAAFRHMINRLQATPLNKFEYKKELNIIMQIAINNGYSPKIIHKLIKNIKSKKKINRPTENNNKKEKWASITYTGKEMYKFKRFFKQYGVNIAMKTNNTIKYKLNNNIEKRDKYNQSGVYLLECECEAKYIGQTGRKLKTRYKEHIRSFKYNKKDSNFANHLINEDHKPRDMQTSMKLIHPINKGTRLNIIENMEIFKLKLKDQKIINEQINTQSNIMFENIKLI